MFKELSTVFYIRFVGWDEGVAQVISPRSFQENSIKISCPPTVSVEEFSCIRRGILFVELHCTYKKSVVMEKITRKP